MSKQKIGFIGAGQMGGALLRGLIVASLAGPDDIWASDADPDRLDKLRDSFGVQTVLSNSEVVDNVDVLIIAIKPQQLADALSGIAGVIKENHIIISIAAGVKSEKVAASLGGHRRIVRVMPNSPALIGRGMSVVSPGAYADREAVGVAMELFGAVGEVIELPEELQDVVTAISGSGPAYFYYLVEGLIEAAIGMGLERDIATKLVQQTISGSAAMLKEDGRAAKDLRIMVTSPGGTTEAAIAIFEKNDFFGIVERAVSAAVRRAKELAE